MKEWTIAHSAKGSSWTKHKYIRKDGNRYVYADQHSSWNRKIGIHERKAINLGLKSDKLEKDPNRADTKHGDFPGLIHDPGALGLTKRAIANYDVANEYRRQRDELRENREKHPKAAFAELEMANFRLSAKNMINKGINKASSILKVMNDAADNVMWGGEEKKKKAREQAKKWDRLINGR